MSDVVGKRRKASDGEKGCIYTLPSAAAAWCAGGCRQAGVMESDVGESRKSKIEPASNNTLFTQMLRMAGVQVRQAVAWQSRPTNLCLYAPEPGLYTPGHAYGHMKLTHAHHDHRPPRSTLCQADPLRHLHQPIKHAAASAFCPPAMCAGVVDVPAGHAVEAGFWHPFHLVLILKTSPPSSILLL